MNKQNLVILCWSQANESISEKIADELYDFLKNNREKIKTILFWGGYYWIMKIVVDVSREVWIKIKWYSTEEYRKYDEWNWVDVEFLKDNDTRVKKFIDEWDLFISLPWAIWTINEITWLIIKLSESWTNKKILTSILFDELFYILNSFEKKWIIAPNHKRVLKIVDNLSTYRI